MISLRAETVAIIGAGPSGLVAAKYLRAEKAFTKIDILEQRSKIGGIWNCTPDETNEEVFSVPQTNPFGSNQDPIWREPSDNANSGENISPKEITFLSPVYNRLETNIPRGLMGFQDLNWPQDSQLFPRHQTVLEYIEEYGTDVKDIVQLETQVVDVKACDNELGGRWIVKTRSLRSGEEREVVYDAVIVANGHFVVPYVPDIPGIGAWNDQYPGYISHSKYFRRPEDFTGKKVVVVGNSASGIDISSQIASLSQQPLLWSSKSPSMFSEKGQTSDARKRELPPISEFFPKTRGVKFEDGTIENDIDAVVFATGYFYSLPFLKNVNPKLITDGTHVQHTYQHLFYAPRPTLSFLVLNQRAIPFPLAEAQSAVLARVYSGRLPLPPLHEMLDWEEKTKSENGNGKAFHLLPFPKDANYINALSKWAMEASPKDGLENEGIGKRPPVWGEWEFWCRERFADIRLAFGKMGEKRAQITSVDELGFSFDKHLDLNDIGAEKLI